MGKKQDVLETIYSLCLKRNTLVFNNDLVKKICLDKGFGNPFDVTKIDNSNILPPALIDDDKFVVHLGNGFHKFVSGISIGYHKFEEISEEEKINWNYRKSLLNEFDYSESNILSVASNQRIIHDFLYEDIVANPKVYGARRTKTSFDYLIDNEKIAAKNIQIEIDLTLELQGKITIVEGKNGFPEDFAVYQLFHPYMYYKQLISSNQIDVTDINCCYICRKVIDGATFLRLYNYKFESANMGSIKLLKKSEYKLLNR